MDNIIELHDIQVMRVRADMKGNGPSAAFDLLESRLATIKGRKFYGVFRLLPNGEEEYYACVEISETDDPEKLSLETGTIPGGLYVRRKVMNWEQVIRNGQLPSIINDLASGKEIDTQRPTIEYYRSNVELQLLVPVAQNLEQ